MSEIIGFGTENEEEVVQQDTKRYKGKTGQTDRIAFLLATEDKRGNPTPMMKYARYHYVDGMGYIEAIEPFTIDRFGSPKTRFAAVIFKYDMDRQGNVLKIDGVPQGELMEYQFSEQMFLQFKNLHQEYDLTTRDIKLSCSDEQFQKMTMLPCAGDTDAKKCVWRSDESFSKQTLAKAKRIFEHMTIARKVTVDQIKEHLKEEVAPPAAVSSSSENYDDIMEDF